MSKVVVLKDFLPKEEAEALALVLNSVETFEHAYKTDSEPLPKIFSASNQDAPQKDIEESKLKKSLVEGNFTYRQKRLPKHDKGCQCAYCNFVKDTLDTKNFAQFIEVLGDWQHDNLKLLKHFASVYDRGDFLSIHPDPNYDVAFILNLTKDWRYEYGGCLTVFDEDKPRVILPEFNSLVLMFLGEKGIDHYVSEVSRLAPHPRIAISGWYNRNSS